MMVKKKTSETESNQEKDDTKTTDNKDHTAKTTTDTRGKEENLPDEINENIPSDSEAGAEDQADKKIPEDKVLIEKLAEMQDRYLRLSAEFDNYRKRTLKEKMDISKYAEEDILSGILPVMDDFERALKHIETSGNCAGIKEGIDLIYIKLSDFLKQHGVTEIESLNSIFNVDLHDAVAKVPVAEEDKKGKIVEVLLKGYFLKDKVLRHSKVVIGE
jgi:molecular chaperone GrpE